MKGSVWQVMFFAVSAYGAFWQVFCGDLSLEQACSLPPLPFCCVDEQRGAGQLERLERVFCDRDACGVVRGALKHR